MARTGASVWAGQGLGWLAVSHPQCDSCRSDRCRRCALIGRARALDVAPRLPAVSTVSALAACRGTARRAGPRWIEARRGPIIDACGRAVRPWLGGAGAGIGQYRVLGVKADTLARTSVPGRAPLWNLHPPVLCQGLQGPTRESCRARLSRLSGSVEDHFGGLRGMSASAGAGGGGRTLMPGKGRWILSPVRLPIPPLQQCAPTYETVPRQGRGAS